MASNAIVSSYTTFVESIYRGFPICYDRCEADSFAVAFKLRKENIC